LSLNKGRLTKDVHQGIKGAALKTGGGSPAVEFKFDEGLKQNEDITTESISGTQCNIDGPATVWKRGVSGTALAFDGYRSKVALPMAQVTSVSDKLTLEAWIAPGAYSVSQWTGIVQHSEWVPVADANYRFDGIEWGMRQLGEKLTEGYFLGIDEYGHIGFQVMAGEELKELVSERAVELYKWTHIAGMFGDGEMSLYINGEPVKSESVAGTINRAKTDLIIGKSDVSIKYIPRHTVRPFSTFGSELSFEGLIDEVRIHGECLSAEDISKSYESMKPDEAGADMEPRTLPGNAGESESFGGSYTKLKFHELWDNMWRTSEWPDILVKFDEMPTSILFWRGTRYGASYVTENNRWMSDQSNELTDWRWDNKPTGCNSTCEHMMDAQLRYGHVRMIENTPARVVVHWRYASCDANYKHTNWDRTNKWGSWIDEYYTIYPDGALVRYVEHNGCLDYYFEVPETPHFSALQVLNPAGEMPEDQLEEKAVTIANLKGETRSFGLDGESIGGRVDEPSIMSVNYKSDHKVYVAYNRAELIKTPWGWEGWWEGLEGDEEESEEPEEEEEEDVDSPRETGLVSTSPLITGPWNHWPISQFLSDGRDCTALDRVGSSELNAGITINAVQAGAMIMYGLTNQDITSLVPMVKAWNYPAAVRNAGEMSSEGYDKTQRAYVFRALSDEMSFMLVGSESRPIVKPCFVIQNWLDRSAKAKLKINGEAVESGPNFRQGVVIDTDGTPTLVIWLNLESKEMTKFELSKG
jgi:hypothetical protein